MRSTQQNVNRSLPAKLTGIVAAATGCLLLLLTPQALAEECAAVNMGQSPISR